MTCPGWTPASHPLIAWIDSSPPMTLFTNKQQLMESEGMDVLKGYLFSVFIALIPLSQLFKKQFPTHTQAPGLTLILLLAVFV